MRPTVTVAVAELAGFSSPVREVDEAWVAALVAAGPPFAPIVVTAPPDSALVDGAHRVRAAIALGLTTLLARVVVAETEADIVAAALRANREQVKLLTRSERKAAALRLIKVAPGWSDRAIARATGCSHTSIARWRENGIGQSTTGTASGGQGGQSTTPSAGQAQRPRCDHRSHRGPAWAFRRLWRCLVGMPCRWLEKLAAVVRRQSGDRPV